MFKMIAVFLVFISPLVSAEETLPIGMFSAGDQASGSQKAFINKLTIVWLLTHLHYRY